MNTGAIRRLGKPHAWLCAAVLLLAAWSSATAEAARSGGDPAARLSKASAATEYWTLTARFDGGYWLVARLGITNEGPGERTAGALWYLGFPDGRVAEFRNGRSKNWWKLSPDRLRLDIASSSLDLHAPRGRLALDTTSQGAKINLEFAGDTSLLPAAPSMSGLHTELLQIAAPIAGTIWVRGMAAPVPVRGTVALTHAWTEEGITATVQRHIEFVAQTPELAVYLSDLTTPAGERRRRLVVERGGAVVDEDTDVELTLEANGLVRGDRNYPLPGRLHVHDSRITLDIQPERLLLRTNPLNGIPQPFRFLFSLKAAPQWIWIDASFHLKLVGTAESPPFETDGRGILAVIFVNPLPPQK
jgi:hypothetical protein